MSVVFRVDSGSRGARRAASMARMPRLRTLIASRLRCSKQYGIISCTGKQMISFAVGRMKYMPVMADTRGRWFQEVGIREFLVSLSISKLEAPKLIKSQ